VISALFVAKKKSHMYRRKLPVGGKREEGRGKREEQAENVDPDP
jgi:hypothetical protein